MPDELFNAADRLRAKYDAEAERLKGNPDWQLRWKAEQKALAARKIAEAISDIITSEGNK